MSQVIFVVGTPALYTLWKSVVDREQLEGNITFAARPYVSDTPDRKKQRLLIRADLCRLVLADRIIFLNIGGSVPTDFRPLIAWCVDKGLRFEWFEPELGDKWLAAHERELRAVVPRVHDLEKDPLHQPKAEDPPPPPRREPPPAKPVKKSPPRPAGPALPPYDEMLPAGTMVRRSDGNIVKTKKVSTLARAHETWARDKIRSTLVYTSGDDDGGDSMWFLPTDVVRPT